MRATDLLWFFVPDHILMLILVVGGIGLMTGIIPRRWGGRLMLVALLMLFAGGLVEALSASLPVGVVLLLLLLLGLALLRGVLALLLGREAAGFVLGSAVVGTVRLFMRAVAATFRAAGSLAGRAPRTR